MLYIKNSVFLNLSPRQKSQLVSFLRSLYKKNLNLSDADFLDKFIEEEKYYEGINSPHFEFALELFDDDTFLSDILKFHKFLKWEQDQKEALKPIIEKKKEFEKKLRQKANDIKMSKLKPTKKQLYYYEKISKAHCVIMKDVKDASRLDLKNWIMEILEPKETQDNE